MSISEIIIAVCSILQTITLAISAYLGLMALYKKDIPPLKKLLWQHEYSQKRKQQGMDKSE